MTGGARALIKEGETGYLINTFNSDDWARKIEIIFSDLASSLLCCLKNKQHFLHNFFYFTHNTGAENGV